MKSILLKKNLSLKFLLLACSFIIICVSPTWGKKVALIKSRSLDEYNTVAENLVKSAEFEMDYFDLEGDPDRACQIMKSLSPEKYRMAITLGSIAVKCSSSLNPNIPLIYSMVLNPFDISQHQATGILIRLDIKDQFAKIRELFPDRKNIGVIYNPKNSSKDVNQAREVCPGLNLNLQPIAIEDTQEIDSALKKLKNNNIQVIWIPMDHSVANPSGLKELIQYSLNEKIPLIGFAKQHAMAGVTVAFAVDFSDLGSQTAVCANSALKNGIKHKIETPRKMTIYVNSTAQKELGLESLSHRLDLDFI